MKRILKWLGIVLAIVVAVIASAAAYISATPIPHYAVAKVDFPVDMTPARVARGKRNVEMLCAACHMDSATGALTGKQMPDLPPRFGQAWSRNITTHPVKGI